MLPYLRVAARSDSFFGGLNGSVMQIMDGMPRAFLPSELNPMMLIYRYLDGLVAHIVAEAIVRIVAWCGAYLLLRQYIMRDTPNESVAGVALCFALLPFAPYSLSVSGQPFLLWALLQIRMRGRDAGVASWFCVALFPFVSELVLVGVFILAVLAGWILCSCIQQRRLPFPLVGAFMLLCGLYLVSQYRLIANILWTTSGTGHRLEFAPSTLYTLDSFSKVIDTAQKIFVHSHYHADSLHAPVVFIAASLAVLSLGLRCLPSSWVGPVLVRHDAEGDDRHTGRQLALLLFTAVLVAFWYGLARWIVVGELVFGSGLPLVSQINLQRFIWFYPLLWTVILGLSLRQLYRSIRWGRFLAVALVGAQIFVVAPSNYHDFGKETTPPMTVGGFLSEELFRDIKAHIGRPIDEYRVVSLGMYPSIALYNGFYVLDGYFSVYPLSHKHLFRAVIADELAKDPKLRHYFDNWGSRCYVFSSELGKYFLYGKDHQIRRVEQLSIDVRALHALGASYILSAVEIGNAEGLRLKLERVFERADSPWQVYLYSLPKFS